MVARWMDARFVVVVVVIVLDMICSNICIMSTLTVRACNPSCCCKRCYYNNFRKTYATLMSYPWSRLAVICAASNCVRLHVASAYVATISTCEHTYVHPLLLRLLRHCGKSCK